MVETQYNLPECPVRIAFLSDTHETDPAAILSSLRVHAPEMILHAGDFVRGQLKRCRLRQDGTAAALLRGCSAIAPTYVSIGNHEAYLTEDDANTVRATGVHLLDNAFVSLCAGQKKLILGGLSSGYYTARKRHGDNRRNPAPETDWLEGYMATEGYHILLVHHPEYYHLLPPAVDLALAGHAHGGQWRFYDARRKAWRGVYAPGQGFLPRLTSGVVDGRLVVSRGLRNTICLPRIHNDTEIIYLSG